MTTKEEKQALIQEGKESLLPLFPKNSEIYCMVTRVNTYSAWIKTMAPGRNEDGTIKIINNNIDPRYPDYWLGVLLGYRSDTNKGILVTGCGMDRGFEIAYNLSIMLHGTAGHIFHRWMS